MSRARRAGLGALAAAAVASRLAWAFAVHPPGDAVFSDMAGYVARGRLLAGGDWLPGPTPTLYPPGTHALLGFGWALGGEAGATALWALMGATIPVAGWLWAERAGAHRWMGPALGVLLLVWPPHLSLGGYFLSEIPFTALTLVATALAAAALQRGGPGRRTPAGIGAGIAMALAFLVRPQVALFGGILALGPLRRRRRLLLALAVPGALAAAGAAGLHHAATGEWAIAGNASLNAAISRCSLERLVLYPDAAERHKAQHGEPALASWWLEPPALRERIATVPADHPLAVRPALGPGPVRVVGSVNDPTLHRRLAERCVARTGLAEQLRSAVVRVGLLWWGERPWPESTDAKAAPLVEERVLPAVVAAHKGSRWVVLPLALVGAVACWRRRSDQPVALLAPAHVLALVAASAWFFGSLRLRTWADPYLLLLALEGAAAVARRGTRPASSRVPAPPTTPP